jgi:RimJ/RimL family protein N-acetyltransferase
MEVRAVTDREQIRAFLVKERVGNVYMLGYLDPHYDAWCKWWGAYAGKGDELKTLLLLYEGLSSPVSLMVGEKRYVKGLLDACYHELPDRFFCHIREAHLEHFQELYDTSELRSSVRMALDRSKFEPVEVQPYVTRLGHRDTAQIVALYEHFPDNLFEPYQLESGLYFGIHRRSGGQLISIAGIHVVSEANDVAVVGNVVTHPKYRQNKLATMVIGRLLNELFERVSLVALNVTANDEAALRTMKRFKFEPSLSFFEGLVRRRF